MARALSCLSVPWASLHCPARHRLLVRAAQVSAAAASGSFPQRRHGTLASTLLTIRLPGESAKEQTTDEPRDSLFMQPMGISPFHLICEETFYPSIPQISLNTDHYQSIQGSLGSVHMMALMTVAKLRKSQMPFLNVKCLHTCPSLESHWILRRSRHTHSHMCGDGPSWHGH